MAKTRRAKGSAKKKSAKKTVARGAGAGGGGARHRLVVLGDSLSQGFMSGAIHRTEMSHPAMVARAMGVPETFRVPDFTGAGGLPLNLERMLHRLGERFGRRVSWLEAAPVVLAVREMMDDVEDYWERGKGSRAYPERRMHHNLAVWGFEVGDALTLTEGVCRRHLERHPARDNVLDQVPEHSMYRTARRVLNPTFAAEAMEWSQARAARELAREGGIENLGVFLGANNALGTVTSLSVRWSEWRDVERVSHERRANLYMVDHFAELYARLAEELEQVGAERVMLGTVPHVTIPPVSRGVSEDTRNPLWESPTTGRRYFEYYTRPWVWDTNFDPSKHPWLGRDQAEKIDATIDGYNEVIRGIAAARGWLVVDVCGVLDRLAVRSRSAAPEDEFPEGLEASIQRDEALSYLWNEDEGRLGLDTRYPRGRADDPSKLAKGGLFSLDGIHPTTIGYSILAHEVIGVLREAGAAFPGLEGADGEDGWWDWIVANDELVRNPPIMLAELADTLRLLDKRGLLSGILDCFG